MAARQGTRQYLAEKMAQGLGGRISVVMDGKDCAECAAKNGKYQNSGSMPPYHPNCRCSVKNR